MAFSMTKNDFLIGKHIMIDLETLGTDGNSYITEIGIVELDLIEGMGQKYEFIIDPQYFKDFDEFTATGETLYWWFTNDPERFKHWFDHGLHPKNAAVSSKNLITEIIRERVSEHYFVWSSPSFFDINILQNLWNTFDIDIPWDHYCVKDLRTLRTVCEWFDIEFTYEEDKTHRAMDDAHVQAKELDILGNSLLKISSAFKNTIGKDHE